jgi:CelD/BcsL family acetyltransferase involved in cellulose biosynthesis
MVVTQHSAATVRLHRLLDLDAATIRRWSRLAEHAAEPNPYVEPDFALAAARHLAGGDRAELLTVGTDAELWFALPVLRSGHFWRAPVPVVQSWAHPYCFLDTPLLHPGRGVSAWRLLRRALARPGVPWWLVLPATSVDGPVYRSAVEATEATRRGRAGVHVFDARPRCVAHRDAGEREVALSTRSRRRLARRRHAWAAELGAPVHTLDLDLASGALDEAIELFLRGEATGWKARQGTALASNPSHAAFFRELCRAYAADNRIELLALWAGDDVAAVTCNLIAQDAVFCFKGGFDDRFASHSPGLQLEVDCLLRFRESRCRSYLDSCAYSGNTWVDRVYPGVREFATIIVAGAATRSETAAGGYMLARQVRARLAEACANLPSRARISRAATLAQESPGC